MTTDNDVIRWAFGVAETHLKPLGDRWLHVQGVAERAKWVCSILSQDDCLCLLAAAYLHDIAYAPSLQKTGFHPIDGAYYLRSHNQERLASLVAYHSGAQFEASYRGLTTELNQFTHEHSTLADALDYCDLTTGPTGTLITFAERIADIFQRYDETHIVNQAIHQAVPTLSLAVERTEQALKQHGILA